MDWSSYVRILSLLLLFGVTYLLVLRPVKKQIIRVLNLPPPNHTAHLASATNANAALRESDELNDGANGPRHVTRLKNDISTRVKQEPASASRLVQSWIRDGER